MQPARPFVPSHVWARQEVRDALLRMDFGRLCQLVREYGHLRQEDIALLTGLSQAFLSMLESGQRRLCRRSRNSPPRRSRNSPGPRPSRV
ncbi:hypothetical protein SAMN04490357_1448 [Streptomyces misionensis]|uniref:Helix-turn-helix domain-containing protein n=1 Tax=Streptomyces misionensis TaxID=67331 RepID=A0A1H4QMI2_9ACTN|nr:hypothetical protein SAMN04490357_1448 [Streptomyces misionensis]